MKSFITVLIIFAILISLITLNSLYVSKTFTEILNISDSIANKHEEASGINTIITIWEKSKKILSFSIESDEMERMNDLIESLRVAYLSNNTYDLNKYCRLIGGLAKELMEYEKISFSSIF